MEQFLHDNSLYVVLGIALILWFGLGFYMFSLDKKVSKLEKQIATNKE